MGMQSALAQTGVAKQSAKGSASANPTFTHGVINGTVMTVDINQVLSAETSGARVAPSVDRTGVIPGMALAFRAKPKAMGLWLYGALGSISTSGAGPTYTHTITSGADLPYLTVFGKLDGNIYAVQDFKVNTFELKFKDTQPVEIDVQGMGTLPVIPATFVAGTDVTLDPFFSAHTGTFSVDVDGAGSESATAKITGGTIKINNNAKTIVVSGSISPDDIAVGRQEVEVSFDVVPADMTLWRTIVTGTPTGTTPQAAPLYGTFSIAFTNGTDSLTLAGARVAFVTKFPDADPAGGPVTITITGLSVQPTGGGTPLTATLVNGVASY